MSKDDHVYLKACNRLKELCAFETERKELEAFLHTYDRLAGVTNALGDTAEPVSAPSVAAAAPSPVKPASTKEIVDVVMVLLSERKEPMMLGDIYDALLRRGLAVGGKIPKYNLGAKLSADIRLRTGAKGWWFANEPYPSRLDGYGEDYEEGPATSVARPLQSNGAADFHSA